MSDDALAFVFANLEETPDVRPAFAIRLHGLLTSELGWGSAAVPAMSSPTTTRLQTTAALDAEQSRAPRWLPVDHLRRLLGSLWPVTPRVVVLVAAALLLLAGTVLAAYVVGRLWLSSGPRGMQFTDDFTLTELVRDPGSFYSDLHLTPDGRSIIGLREPITFDAQGAPQRHPTEAAIVRIDITDPVPTPTVVLPLDRLEDPAYWDVSADLSVGGVQRSPAMIAGDGVSIASGGDLFLAASLGMVVDADGRTDGPASSALVVVHPDGSAQKVVTVKELAEAGLLGPLLASNGLAVSAVATAPDLLWARAEYPVEVGAPGNAFALFEIGDPDGDGDWADRVIRPLQLPTLIPAVPYGVYDWIYGAFVAEPSSPGRDRSQSVLLPVAGHGEFRVYRIADPDRDGDATDPGEAELVYAGATGPDVSFPTDTGIAPRLVIEDRDIVIDELVATSLTHATRISRITADGVVDIVRALSWPAQAALADQSGNVFVLAQVDDSTACPTDPSAGQATSTSVIYRLSPVPVGSSGAQPSATPAPDRCPTATASPDPLELEPVAAGVPRIGFTLMGPDASEARALVIGADGSGPAELIPGDHVLGFCQSTDAHTIAFWADDEAPNEPFLYLLSDGDAPAKISETYRQVACPFAGDAVPVLFGDGVLFKIVRLDPETGHESTLAERVSVLAASPDGRQLALGDDYEAKALSVLDVTSGLVTQVIGPVDQVILGAAWSAGGDRLAYVVGPSEIDAPPERQYDIYVADPDGSDRVRLLTTSGVAPRLTWDPRRSQVAIRTASGQPDDPRATGALFIADTTTGRSQVLVDEMVVFAGWSPLDPGALAYATREALFLATGDDVRRLAPAPTTRLCTACTDEPKSGWPMGDWLGWSPDGRFIGLGDWSSAIAVVDVATGDLRLLYEGDGTSLVLGQRWLR